MIVYYFSGTGNSFALAKEIAEKIGAELISIAKIVKEEKIHINAESICIVFPSYLAPLSGLPIIVDRFVRKIDNMGDLTIIAVCNCGGYESVNAHPSLNKLQQIVKSCGGELYAEYSLRLPMNNLEYDHIPIPINRATEDLVRKSKVEIDRICTCITKRKKTRYKVLKRLFFHMMKPVYKLIQNAVIKELKVLADQPQDSELLYSELIPMTDKSINVDEKCNGCGICAKVCPVDNIKIVNQRPEFQHRCEMCFACDEWCPTMSIRHWSRKNGVKYHHPEVTIKDMLP